MENYDIEIEEAVGQVLSVMSERVSEEELQEIRRAYEFARTAHAGQKRKSGHPYIIHPIAVALIAAQELRLDASSVKAAFLHDVVEDTEYTLKDIENEFGSDVAFLVDVVTKKKKDHYNTSKQVDNYQQLLDSIHYDIRALMVKIADRLHNMRTLQSMRPDKQMKIAGETDYFYAPLANRLGLFDVKTDLENLSFKYRCELLYSDISRNLEEDQQRDQQRLQQFTTQVENILFDHGIQATARVFYRKPYSLWRRMLEQDKDYWHVPNRYYVRVTFTACTNTSLSEKNVCLRIYSLLTDVFKEKPQSFVNQIDMAKENSYQSLNVMLLSNEGVWEDVQICSHRMVESSRLGCMASRNESNVGEWIDRFRLVLKDIASQSQDSDFIEKVATQLYYDDVMVFTPRGLAITLPKGATALDFAFELHKDMGLHAKYCRINGKLSSVKTVLRRGDCVEIGTDPAMSPRPDWCDHVVTYKAKRALRNFGGPLQTVNVCRCPECSPLPGGETIGIRQEDETVMIHRRSCPVAIATATKLGDNIVDAPFHEDPSMQYPVTLSIKAIDRYHLLIDLIDHIANHLHLSIDSLTTTTRDEIVDCRITFFVHSVRELVMAISHLYNIPGVDEVREG